MSDEFIQTDSDHPTGTVRVEVAPDGQPAFVIADDVAWDYVEWGPGLEGLAESARAVCYGTLAQRRTGTRETIRRFLGRANRPVLRVCDINLRPPFVSEEVIRESVAVADWVKLNEGELGQLSTDLVLPGRTLLCVTRGADGARVRTRDEVIDVPGVPVEVADTVGCGDAFTAALLTRHLEGKPLANAARFANAYAAVVASRRGGTPRVEWAEVERLL